MGQGFASDRNIYRVPDRAELDGDGAGKSEHQNRQKAKAHGRPHRIPERALRLDTLRLSSSSVNSGVEAATGAGALAAPPAGAPWRLLAMAASGRLAALSARSTSSFRSSPSLPNCAFRPCVR